MTRRPTKPSPDQLTLPFGQPPEIAIALRSIDWRVTGCSEHCWRQIREILIAVVYCGSRDCCFARRETLLTVANEHRDSQSPEIGTTRSFDRRHKQAIDMGLLEVTKRYRQTAVRRVNIPQVEALVLETRKLAEKTRQQSLASAQKAVSIPLSIPVSSQCQVSVDSTGNSKLVLTNTSSPQLLSTQSTGRRATKKIDWEQVPGVARAVVRKLGRAPRKSADRSLLLKAVALSQRLSEHWLHDAVEGVVRCRPKNCWAYLHREWSNSCRERGLEFNELLASVRIPAEVWSPVEQIEPKFREVSNA